MWPTRGTGQGAHLLKKEQGSLTGGLCSPTGSPSPLLCFTQFTASELLLNLTDWEKEREQRGESDTQREGEREDFKENSFQKINSTASFDEVLEL